MNFLDFLQSYASKKPHFLLLGEPVSHSLSPQMHNTALRYHGIDAEYIAVSISYSEFNRLASHFNSSSFLGANITIPHKEQIIPLLDSLTDVANSIGAVNTIIKNEEKLIGDNTDAYGFSVPLMSEELGLETDRAIVFGSGGATKSIVVALNDLGFKEVYMVSRSTRAGSNSSRSKFCTYDSWIDYADEATLIVNATPLGMTPDIDSSPVDQQFEETLEGKVVYDIVYNPRRTKLIKQTEQAGGIPIGGLEMLIHQGALSFKKWTGKEFPIQHIANKLNEFI